MVAYKQRCGICKNNWALVTSVRQKFPVCKDCEMKAIKQKVEDKEYAITCVSVGNPHCVIFTDTLDVEELRKYGPLLENNKLFPNRINVQFAKVISRNEIEILIWERGAGETSASGSSSCAVACAAKKTGLVDDNITIKSPGGELKIQLHDLDITMTGPATEVYTAEISKEFLQSISHSL